MIGKLQSTKITPAYSFIWCWPYWQKWLCIPMCISLLHWFIACFDHSYSVLQCFEALRCVVEGSTCNSASATSHSPQVVQCEIHDWLDDGRADPEAEKQTQTIMLAQYITIGNFIYFKMTSYIALLLLSCLYVGKQPKKD